MDKFTVLTAVAAPMMQANVDTDIIIPMARMVTAERADMHQHAFEPWRFRNDGSENPQFVLNRPPFQAAEILIVGANFGCGSSREGAVWALQGLGIRCLIGSSFGAIFYNNCFQNGILPVVLPSVAITQIADQVAASGNSAVVTVDLQSQLVIPSIGAPIPFEIEPNRRIQLLDGLDDIGMTLERADEIDTYRQIDKKNRPWIYRGD